MKRLWIISFLILAGCSQYLHQPVRITKPRIGVESEQQKILKQLPEPKEAIVTSVYKFRDQTGQYKDTEMGTSWSTAITQGATSILLKSLENSKWFLPIEREGLNNLLNERKIIRSSRESYGNSGGQPVLPPLLFGGVLLEGGIISFDSNIMTGGAGARYFGIGASGQYRLDRITIYLRAVSTSNGRILKTVYTSKTILSQQVDVGIFKYVDFRRLLEAETGFTYNEPSEMAVREAIEKAVISLIIEGIIDGLWELKNPADREHQVIKNYIKEKQHNDLVDVFGSEFSNRRSNISIGAFGGTNRYLGDLKGGRFLPSAGIELGFLANRPLSLQLITAYGGLGTEKYYRSEIGIAELSGTYMWFHELKGTPYLRLGAGAMTEIYDRDTSTKIFKETFPYIVTELGYEHLVLPSLGVYGGAAYRYSFSDKLDNQLYGSFNDAFFEARIGVKFYFNQNLNYP